MRRWVVLVCGLVVTGIVVHGQTSGRASQPTPVFRANTELVLVNVVVRDRSGKVVRGLSASDFVVTEDDKPQTVTSFDFEELDTVSTAPSQDVVPVLPRNPGAKPPANAAPAAPRAPEPVKVDMRGRRLFVLFFDLSSMQPEELQRAAQAAHDYVDSKLSPADLIA